MPEYLPSWDTHDVASLRRFASVRLIALDLDGTLVRPLSSDVYRTIVDLQASLSRQGVCVTFATGRTFEGVVRLLGDWSGQKNLPLILYNGSIVLIRSPLRALRSVRLQRGSLNYILQTCSRYDVTVLSYAFVVERMPFFETAQDMEQVFGWSRGVLAERDINGLRIHWLETWDEATLPAPTAVLIDVSRASEVIALLLGELRQHQEITVTRSGATYLEIRPEGSNKATAIACVADYLEIDRVNTLALGDNDNDVEILRWCGTGVTVAGASQEALGASDFICRHGVADGVVETLRLVKQARRYFPTLKPSKPNHS